MKERVNPMAASASVRSEAVNLLLFIFCCRSHSVWGFVLSICFVV